MRYLLLLLGAVACSPASGDDGEQSCSRTDRTGTYLIRYSERDGDCGPIAEQIGRLDAAEAPGADCVLTAPDAWEDGECTLTRSLECVDPSGVVIQGIAITTQEGDGERITGIYDVTGRDAATAQVICSSTYDVVATRQ